MMRDYLARFIEQVEVDGEKYARQRFVDVSQIGGESSMKTGKKTLATPCPRRPLAPRQLLRTVV
jgi:hypothetical protein